MGLPMLKLPRWIRLERLAAGQLRWCYPAAAIGLLILAAALRFYELGQPLAHHDEIVAALNSGGTLAEVVHNTRTKNSSPLLYPLILWAVQQVDISPFSIRLVPALSGVLTVAVILLLPRFGIRRNAALLAAILAALAPAAIYEARGAREYGVDALVAALLIAGLLWYRSDGRKALLCIVLLVAPLLQYGLILFGAAVIAAGLLLPPVSASPEVSLTPTGRPRRERILDWLRRRISLAWPAAFFLAGCVITYLTTLRYQLEIAGQGYMLSNYYRELLFTGEYQIVPVLEFAIVSVWGIAQHHLPPVVTLTVVGVLAIWLLSAGIKRLRRRRDDSVANIANGGRHWDVVAMLFALALTVAVGAAVLGQYPASPTRHITYLGPAVFVFSGVALAAAFHELTGRMSLTTPRGRQLALAVAVSPANLDQTPAGPSRQITFVRPKVFVFGSGALSLTLAIIAVALIIGASIVAIQQDNPYRVAKAADYFTILEQSVHTDDIVYITGSVTPVMTFYSIYQRQQWPDNYIQSEYDCWNSFTMCAIDIAGIVSERENEIGDVWVVFHRNLSPKLERYDKEGALETFADFRDARNRLTTPSLSLHRFPADAGLLHSVRQEWPEEDMAARRHFEQTNIAVLDATPYADATAAQPAARSVFNLYHDDDTLLYAKSPCAPDDTVDLFFLHLTPAYLNVLREPWRTYGFANRDFSFDRYGMYYDRKCLISVPLPEYEITGISTGQYAGDNRIWQVQFAP